MIKRQRGRGRNPGQKPQNNNPNRAYESNGPDLKVRGSAQTVFEKYQQLGRDAQSNGDRVLGENYMQHAEHYFRVLRAMQPTFVPRSELMIAGYDDEEYEGDEGVAASEAGDIEAGERQNGPTQSDFQQGRLNRDNRDRDNRDNRDRDPNRERPQRDFRDQREPRDPNEPRAEGEEGRYGRRRRRPDRFGNDANGSSQGENDHNQRHEIRSDYRQDTQNGTRNEGRYEGRREARPDYRGEGQMPSNPPSELRPESRAETASEAATAFSEPGFAQPISYSEPQEMIVAAPAPPTRERRPRPPRATRAPRDDAGEKAETGFGDELPAFLSAPIPAVSGE
jgi:hypothetical protein